MKELSNKWRENIRKMVEYAQRSHQLQEELVEYLNKHVDNETVESLIDYIIDTNQQTGDYSDLITTVEYALNGTLDEKIEEVMEERMRRSFVKLK